MTAKLIYFATQSLDGYVEDARGKIDFTAPDEASRKFVNDALRPTGTYLYGRRMYETMLVWNQFGASESDPPWAREFGSTWRAAEKVIYSKTLKQLSMPMARLEPTFDADAVRDMKFRQNAQAPYSASSSVAGPYAFAPREIRTRRVRRDQPPQSPQPNHQPW